MDFSEAALDERIASGQAQLTEAEGKQFLAQAGVQIPQGAVAKTCEEVLEAARRIGYPVVLKGQLREVTHKSDLGLVKVNIKNDEELKAQYEDISGKCEKLGSDWHVLVEQMLDTSVEMIAAINEDPVFGKVLMFGLGGIYVEVMKDISFGICPITRDDARQMIQELRCSKIFDGARGRAPIDREKIVDFLMSLGGRGGICEKYDSRVATARNKSDRFHGRRRRGGIGCGRHTQAKGAGAGAVCTGGHDADVQSEEHSDCRCIGEAEYGTDVFKAVS